MLKLLQINVTDEGSTGKIATAIGEVAIQQGWESWIAHGRGKGSANKSNLIRIGKKLDVIIHGLATRLIDRHGLSSKKATRKLIKKIEKIKPDIIHLHNIHGYYINYEILFDYLSESKVPIIWTLHDCWSFTGHCSHFMRTGCEKWKSGCFNCDNLKEYPISYYDNSKNNYLRKKKTFTSVEKQLTLVPVSQFVDNYISQSFFKNCNHLIIRNGINLNLFKPVKPKKNYSVLAVSSIWDHRKGYDDVLKLRNLLPEKYEIIIVGLTEQQISSLPKGIKGIERTSNQEELASLYSQASFFINTTYEDNLPTVNLEALACGTPVITYDTGGSPETIDDKTGFVVPKGDINALAKTIISNIEKVPQMSLNARQRAIEMFDQTKCFQKYLELYSKSLYKSS